MAKELWEAFRNRPGVQTRNALITHYLPLVERVAGHLASRLPSHIEVGELCSSGITGLVRAIEGYESGYRTRFESYATLLIKGSIIDQLRSNNWVPRSVYRKANEIGAVRRELELELGRSPSDEELAHRLQLPLSQLEELLECIRPATLLSFDRIVEDGEDVLAWQEQLADERAVTGAQEAQRLERKAMLENRIRLLSKQERKVVVLYYFDGLMLKEIGELLGLSESRISQIHSKALLHLREELEGLQEDLRAD